jgi:hypothetical protein
MNFQRDALTVNAVFRSRIILVEAEPFMRCGFSSKFYVQYADSFLILPKRQCRGSGRYLTGSDFLKRSDPTTDVNKFSAKFLLEIFLRKYAL